MKRLLLILTIACLSFGAKAQVRSLGVIVGAYEAVSFQHGVYGTENVFQLDLGYHTGLPKSGSIRLMGSYNIMLYSPEWTKEGDWNFYVGPGVYLGGGWAEGKGLTFGVMAVVGLEYLFESIPLQVSADMRPTMGMLLTNDMFIYDKDCLLSLTPTLAVRYMF